MARQLASNLPRTRRQPAPPGICLSVNEMVNRRDCCRGRGVPVGKEREKRCDLEGGATRIVQKGLWRSEGAGYFGNRRLWVRLRPTAIRSKAAVVAQE